MLDWPRQAAGAEPPRGAEPQWKGAPRAPGGGKRMFDLGPFELLIISVLAWWAFHRFIARRWPDFQRAVNFAFAFAVVMTLLFGLLARLR